MVLGSVNRSLRLPRPGGRGSLWLAIRVPRAWRLTRLARIGLAEAVGTQGVPVEDRHGCGASNTGRGLSDARPQPSQHLESQTNRRANPLSIQFSHELL
jgi:hypothetical protein